jgi:tetratricopeptide (TPR) repeat protein
MPVALLLGIGLFALYALGACPTIYVGDSGELVTAVHTLGIPHPPGSPLYVLVGKAFTLAVPVGSVAYRMSLFSAVCAAAACALLYRLCRRLDLGLVPALLAAFLLALAPSFWGEANVQRVYSLGALFVVLATDAAFRWDRGRDPRHLALAFFLAGLGATAHIFMTVYAVALGVFVLVREPGIVLRPGRLAAVGGALLAGLAVYAYLPLRSRMDPRLDWGNPETLEGFLDVVLRRDFWMRRWIETPGDVLTIVADWLASLGGEVTWVGAALVVVGIVAGWRRGLPVLLPLLVMAGNVASMAAHGSRSDLFIWHRYYIPSYAMAALLAGIGCQALVERLPRAARVALLAVPLWLLVTGWAPADRSHYRIAEDFSLRVLESLPPGAHLIATDDNILFVLMYLHLVEGRRPDVDLILQGVGDADLPPLRFNPDSDPVFFTHHPNWNLPQLDVVARGLVFQAWRRDMPPPEPIIVAESLAGEDDPRVPKDYLTQNLVGHLHYMLGVTYETLDWPRAAREFALAQERAPDNDVLFYNLGLIYSRNGLYDEAERAFARSDAVNPRHLASAKKPRAADRLVEVRAEKSRVAGIEATLAAGAGLPPGGAGRHARLADLLEARGEGVAARGHRLRAGAPS